MAKHRLFVVEHRSAAGTGPLVMTALLGALTVVACAAGGDAAIDRRGTGAAPADITTGGARGTGGDPSTDTGGASVPSGGTTGGTAPSGGAGGSGGAGEPAGGSGGPPATGGRSAPTGGDCGLRSGMRGKVSRSVVVGSTTRTFISYLPAGLNPSTPAPLVYVFHGANQSGQGLYDMTEYAKLADQEGIAVVFPDGQGTSSATGQGSLTPWNVSDGPALCGLGALVNNPNTVDFAFVDAMREELSKDQCVDGAHVYATGFSMGGYFSHHIACDRPDFRAAAPHSGGTYGDLSSCKTTRMPIIIFHGQSDVLISAGCNDPTAAEQAGFPASATLWAKRNGCKATYTSMPETMGQCFLYDGCPAGGQVEMCSFPGLGHAWAGAPVCGNCIGSGAGFASATRLQWEFFKKYAW